MDGDGAHDEDQVEHAQPDQQVVEREATDLPEEKRKVKAGMSCAYKYRPTSLRLRALCKIIPSFEDLLPFYGGLRSPWPTQ